VTSDANSNAFLLFPPDTNGDAEYGSSGSKGINLYDPSGSHGNDNGRQGSGPANAKPSYSNSRDGVELRVSKTAFDCPEDFWNHSNDDEDDDDLKITTSAPSLELPGEHIPGIMGSSGSNSGGAPSFGMSMVSEDLNAGTHSSNSSLPNKKRRISALVGSDASGVVNPMSAMADEYPDFVAPVEWRMIRNEITKDLKVGEWAFDCATLEMWWSVEIFQIFDLDQKVAKPTFASYKKLLHQDDKDLVLFLFQRALEKGVPYEVSHRFTMPNDKVKWCRVKCRVQLDPSRNNVTKLFGTIQDITLWSKSVIDGRKSLNAFVEGKQQDQTGNVPADSVAEDPTCTIC